MGKNTYRIIICFTSTLILYILFTFSFSYETTIDDKLHLVLPASMYISGDKSLTFEYPDVFKAYTRDFSGNEIIHHVDLLTGNTEIHGYVEVWNLGNESLSVFLEKAKAAFSPSIRNFKESFPSGSVDMREWEYTVKTEENEIHTRQYFSRKDNKLLVISLFAPQNTWSSKYDNMFNEIKDSVRLTY